MAAIEAHPNIQASVPAHRLSRRVHGIVASVLALMVLASVVVVAPVAARDTSDSQADRVIASVSRHLGARYRWGSTGPSTFDCSGLVYRAFKQSHLAGKIGGFNTAHGYYYDFRKRGRTSKRDGQPGDIVVYDRGGHVGIYLGGGKVISALLSGVKRHPLRGLNIKFTTFVHLGLSQESTMDIARASHATYRRAAHALPLRARPSGTARFVRRVHKDQRLKVLATRDLGHRGVWIKVKLPGGDTGWARRSRTTPA